MIHRCSADRAGRIAYTFVSPLPATARIAWLAKHLFDTASCRLPADIKDFKVGFRGLPEIHDELAKELPYTLLECIPVLGTWLHRQVRTTLNTLPNDQEAELPGHDLSLSGWILGNYLKKLRNEEEYTRIQAAAGLGEQYRNVEADVAVALEHYAEEDSSDSDGDEKIHHTVRNPQTVRRLANLARKSKNTQDKVKALEDAYLARLGSSDDIGGGPPITQQPTGRESLV